MGYTIIIPYRDREEHLSSLLPRLEELMQGEQYEIIVTEQDDTTKFKKNILYNVAAQQAKYDTLIFHDVDYYPGDNVSYKTEPNVPLYPVRQVLFLGSDNEPLPIDKVPAGYRQFSQDVGNHSGGVFVMSKQIFEDIKGFNPYYFGWGKEDDDTRDRVAIKGYKWHRNDIGSFFALYHEPIGNLDNDPDWHNNNNVYGNYREYLDKGYADCDANVDEYDMNGVRWLKLTNLTVK